jgi:hypothetical protein
LKGLFVRWDMAKVIVERPRGGWRLKDPKGERRRRCRFAADEQPKRESTSRRWRGGTKFLSEHLGPLRRFLLSKVGRPWNKVFAEICANINRDSAVQDHVRDHVYDFVETQVILIDGFPCYARPRIYGEPLGSIRCRQTEMYVCPKSGILKRVKARHSKKRKAPVDRVALGDGREYRRIRNIWYEVEMGYVKKELTIVEKRQLNKREIAHLLRPLLRTTG